MRNMEPSTSFQAVTVGLTLSLAQVLAASLDARALLELRLLCVGAGDLLGVCNVAESENKKDCTLRLTTPQVLASRISLSALPWACFDPSTSNQGKERMGDETSEGSDYTNLESKMGKT